MWEMPVVRRTEQGGAQILGHYCHLLFRVLHSKVFSMTITQVKVTPGEVGILPMHVRSPIEAVLKTASDEVGHVTGSLSRMRGET